MPNEGLDPQNPSNAPLIFISHDSRDAELAEAFSDLLRSVSAGMLKSFRSSDKKGTEGIEFGDEWYKRLMEKLTSASDVVCLLEHILSRHFRPEEEAPEIESEDSAETTEEMSEDQAK